MLYFLDYAIFISVLLLRIEGAVSKALPEFSLMKS